MLRRSLLALGTSVLFATAAGAQGQTVTVMASDFKFELPDSISAGLTTFRFRSSGPELHHLQIVRIEQGKTLADFNAAMQTHGPPPSWVVFVGGPNAPVPDGQAVATVTLNMPAGQYVLLCFIPSPSDNKPHVMKGMVRPLKVTRAAAGVTQAAAPKADYVMTLYDYNFDIDKPLKAGTRTIEFKNTAKQAHEALLVKLPPSVPVNAVLEWMSAGMKGPPPAMPVGGIVGMAAGQTNTITVDLEPGEYGLYCFLPAPDGKEHIAHGMFKQVTVTK